MDKQSAVPELLAPAGNLETALAAFDAGADAVYGGLAKFNARERAANFSAADLGRLLDYAHSRGRRVYLTFNTLLKESELGEAAEFLAELAKLRPDALIVQDLAVIRLCRSYFPELTLHASTQMGIHNSAGIAAAARRGIARVILERQVTLEELRAMAENSPVELEVFVHGSLCCSLSGRCLLSSALGGWSGNRGKCKQPCRRRYRAEGAEGFLLSPRDLSAVSLIPEFRRLGIASLKVEGRLRSPDYVWKTVRAYRMLLDGPPEPGPELVAEAEQLLRSTATRRPSLGFYVKREYPALIDAGRLGAFGNVVGSVTKRVRNGLCIHTSDRLHLGDRLRLVPPDGGEGESFTLINLEVQRRPAVKVRADTDCFIPGDFPAQAGFLLYKIGENGYDFSRQAASLPAGRFPVAVRLTLSASEWRGEIAELPGEVWSRPVEFQPAERKPFAAAEAETAFASGVPEPWSADRVEAAVAGSFFVPASVLKELRREFWSWAAQRLKLEERHSHLAEALARFYFDYRALPGAAPEPPAPAPEFTVSAFIPERELDAARQTIRRAWESGVRRFRIGGIHGFELLRPYPGAELVTMFPLQVPNSMAALFLKEEGAVAAEPAVALDRDALEQLERKSPLPLEPHRERVPLLVTRAPLPAGGWRDERGNGFEVKFDPATGLTELYSAVAVSFLLNDWK